MITYTVLDPDDGSGRTYRWYGESMVYVHQDGAEVDAFEVDHDPSPSPAAPADVVAAVERHLADT